MGRSLPRFPKDDGEFGALLVSIAIVLVLGCLIAYFNYQAGQGGTGAAPPHKERVPSPTVPNDNSIRR